MNGRQKTAALFMFAVAAMVATDTPPPSMPAEIGPTPAVVAMPVLPPSAPIEPEPDSRMVDVGQVEILVTDEEPPVKTPVLVQVLEDGGPPSETLLKRMRWRIAPDPGPWWIKLAEAGVWLYWSDEPAEVTFALDFLDYEAECKCPDNTIHWIVEPRFVFLASKTISYGEEPGPVPPPPPPPTTDLWGMIFYQASELDDYDLRQSWVIASKRLRQELEKLDGFHFVVPTDIDVRDEEGGVPADLKPWLDMTRQQGWELPHLLLVTTGQSNPVAHTVLPTSVDGTIDFVKKHLP